MEKIIFLVVLALSHVTSDRVYESECPEVQPMQGFDMEKVRQVLVCGNNLLRYLKNRVIPNV